MAGQSEAAAAVMVASAPTNFGVQRIPPPGAWNPDPIAVLDAIAGLGYLGTELGPPGYLGDGDLVRRRLAERGLRLVGSFQALHFSRSDRFSEERKALGEYLQLVCEASTDGARPFVILAEGFGEPDRKAYAGRIQDHPEAWLPSVRFDTLISNLHRAAEDCRAAGLEPVLHHHAGTYIETGDEIRRVLDAMDTSLLGLCLDTGHACLGGADPVALVDEYHEIIRHVHLKDLSWEVTSRAITEGKDFMGITLAGAFCPLGQGDAKIDAAVAALRRYGYSGWMVVEQDRFLFEGHALADLVALARQNRDYVNSLGL